MSNPYRCTPSIFNTEREGERAAEGVMWVATASVVEDAKWCLLCGSIHKGFQEGRAREDRCHAVVYLAPGLQNSSSLAVPYTRCNRPRTRHMTSQRLCKVLWGHGMAGRRHVDGSKGRTTNESTERSTKA